MSGQIREVREREGKGQREKSQKKKSTIAVGQIHMFRFTIPLL